MKKKIKNETPITNAEDYLHPEEVAEVNRLWAIWKNELEIDPQYSKTKRGNFQGLFEIGIRLDIKSARKVLSVDSYHGARLLVAAAYDQNRE